MNEKLFFAINSLAGNNNLIDMIAIFLAKELPYLFIFIEIYLYFVAKKKNEAIFAFNAMLISLLANQIIGLFYFHNRPFMDKIGYILISHSPENSFPSDHTTFMMAIAISLLWYKDTKIWGKVLFCLAFVGGFARVYVGVHYPFDIIGSITTAFVGAFIVYKIKHRLLFVNNYIFKIEKKFFRKIDARDS